MDIEILEKLEKEDKKLASLNSRVLAHFIDTIICSILIYFLIVFFFNDNDIEKIRFAMQNQDIEQINIFLLKIMKMYIVIKFFYLSLFFYMYGATLGNLITKTKIVNYEHLDSPNLFESLNRALVFMICEIFLNGVLFLFVFTNKTRRHLADLASKSVVIKVD